MTLGVQILKDKFTQSLGLPFKEILPSSVIEQAMKELKIRYYQRLFDPMVTLWAFLSQVLDTDKSCHNAVSKVIAYLAGLEVEIPSTDTSAYCQARSRLPETLLQKLFHQTGKSLEEKVTIEYLWCGRNVKVIDGSTVSMPDTVENQKAYPQPRTQKPGCGFPIAKIGVIFSLATGAAVALVIRPLAELFDGKVESFEMNWLHQCDTNKQSDCPIGNLNVWLGYKDGHLKR
ncbi:transposase domain-containing protein [Nostoc sp.]